MTNCMSEQPLASPGSAKYVASPLTNVYLQDRAATAQLIGLQTNKYLF